MGLFKAKKKKKDTEIAEDFYEEEEDIEDESDDDDAVEEDKLEKFRPKKEVKEPKELWSVADVVTDTRQVIVNNKTGEQYDLYSAVVEILNRTE